MKTSIDPGMLARAVAGIRYAVTGKAPEWMGPGEPVAPQAQEQARGRQFDFPFSVNTQRGTRDTGAISFAEMRALADGCDILRLVIETRKDQMSKLKWEIRPRNNIDTGKETQTRCKTIADFFSYPDQEHNWQTWLRILIEDLLVIDAPTIYIRPDRAGRVYAFEPIDGATIKRVIDATGRTPLPPYPAYQQIIKGVAAVDYSRDELIYMPRNVRTSRIYGYSPVEQVIMTINIAMRRQLHQLQFYTEGNIPEALIGVPESWNPDQIRQFQEYWDSLIEGNTAARRHAKFIPGELKLSETKQGALKDEYDEWLARVVCFAFNIEPTPFVKQQNRATAETAREQALSEGLAPLQNWVSDLINLMLAKWMDSPDLEFSWSEEEAVDPLVQAQINQIYLNCGVVTADEVREKLGMTAMEEAPKNEAPKNEAPKNEATSEKLNKAAAEPINLTVNLPEIKISPPDVVIDIAGTNVYATIQPPPVPNVIIDAPVTVNIPEAAPAVVNLTLPELVTNVEAVMPQVVMPDVKVENIVYPAAVELSLPKRRTETTITRDQQGEISRMIQIEKDQGE